MTAVSGADAVENGREITGGYSGMCQKYVRDPCWRVPSLYGSAIDAWNGARDKHAGDRTPPVGAPCYYRGGQYGHAVICVGGGRIRSTDSPSGGQISEQEIAWPEHAWGYEYLGWTGDLNGVELPLESEDDVSKQDVIDALNSDAGQKAIRRAVWELETKRADNGEPITTKDLVRYTHANTT